MVAFQAPISWAGRTESSPSAVAWSKWSNRVKRRVKRRGPEFRHCKYKQPGRLADGRLGSDRLDDSGRKPVEMLDTTEYIRSILSTGEIDIPSDMEREGCTAPSLYTLYKIAYNQR
ncbi:hypothetical protein FRC07_014992 [Ceratobasidium sp. 392]|nr:hypothetical protein FRC07_014992 [Ceratobasidium sp. 392]